MPVHPYIRLDPLEPSVLDAGVGDTHASLRNPRRNEPHPRPPVIQSERSESRDLHLGDAMIKARHTRLLLCVLLAAAALAGGCQRSESRPDSASAAKKPAERPRIALVMKSLANEFFVTMADGARKHQAAHTGDYELIVNGIKDESDMSAAGRARRADGRQRRGRDRHRAGGLARARAVLRKAQKDGVVVVNIDNKLDDATLRDGGSRDTVRRPGQPRGREDGGRGAGETPRPGDAVAILEGIPTAFNAQQRRQGFEDAMRTAGMRVVAVQSGHWEQARANAVVSAMLREHPDLKAILASNDSMALGAVAAVRQGGKTGQVAVVGFDNISAIRELLRDGRVLATADQHAAQLAVFGIEYALQILRGQAKPQDRRTPVDLVTAEKI